MDTIRRAIFILTLGVAAFAASIPRSAHAADTAASYIVIDAATGHVLQGESTDKKLQVASITKIATAMVVLDWADATKRDLNEFATVPVLPANLVASSNAMNLQPGDRVTVRDLLYAALMQSDNIAAFTLAHHVGQALPREPKVTAEQAFVAQMNALARRLKMERTLFLNPHGLDSLEGKLPYSTSSDIARLAAYAMARSGFRFYVSQKEREVGIQREDSTVGHYMLRNTNELLGVNSIDGVKTGTTRKAGECLVISAARAPESVKNGETYIITPRRLIVVVLGATNRFPLSSGLLNKGWQLYDEWAAKGRPLKKDEGLIL